MNKRTQTELAKRTCDCWCHNQDESGPYWKQGSEAHDRGCRYCGFILGQIPQKWCNYNNPSPKIKERDN